MVMKKLVTGQFIGGEAATLSCVMPALRENLHHCRNMKFGLAPASPQLFE